MPPARPDSLLPTSSTAVAELRNDAVRRLRRIHDDDAYNQKQARLVREQDERIQSIIRGYVELGQWTCAPPELSIGRCASRGWKCVDTNLLQCTECNRTLSVELPPMTFENLAVYGRCLSNAVASLDTAHDVLCEWRTLSCRSWLPPAPGIARRRLLERFSELGAFKFTFRGVGIVPELMSALRDTLCLPNTESTNTRLSLAILDWNPQRCVGSTRLRLACNWCGASFTMENDNNDEQFDVIASHHVHCTLLESDTTCGARWLRTVESALADSSWRGDEDPTAQSTTTRLEAARLSLIEVAPQEISASLRSDDSTG